MVANSGGESNSQSEGNSIFRLYINRLKIRLARLCSSLPVALRKCIVVLFMKFSFLAHSRGNTNRKQYDWSSHPTIQLWSIKISNGNHILLEFKSSKTCIMLFLKNIYRVGQKSFQYLIFSWRMKVIDTSMDRSWLGLSTGYYITRVPYIECSEKISFPPPPSF